ncbi:unnamed protein product [marine sediment metagenome]|uniref:Uncharacterized protein n=1 Tax=marine sediment metagenome TaxID=412755 RepID=X1KNG1_9ZZZZ
MIRITSIEPQYSIGKDNEPQIKDFLVSFELRKKLASNGGFLAFSGTFATELTKTMTKDMNSLKGKILYNLKNIV